ncbi:NUDIX hydrolase [Nakamurella sp. A5-74]|uniref:NUDIX hydrolase n=1 Tax=Nakamurella sp. A5-74 TaxID=3158264 RepID=A0AAU8DLJ8_9ACTN
MFETRSSNRVFDGKVVRLRIDSVVMPDGGVADREVVEHDLAVAVVALDAAQRVTLIEQYRHPLGRRIWELPAGLMDVPGESALLAAQRELAEEVGLRADRWDVLVDLTVSPGFTTEAVRVYLARELTEIDRPGEIVHEEADLRTVRVPLPDAVRAVLAGDIVNGAAVGGILATELVLRTGVIPRSDTAWTSGPALEAQPRPDLGRDLRW